MHIDRTPRRSAPTLADRLPIPLGEVWRSWRREPAAPAAGLDRLGDHLLRDIGLRRDGARW
jgi:hypothetical protein